jgi:tetratricopeptide (TPR) repeat protein
MTNSKPNLNQVIEAIKNKDYPYAREILKVIINSDPNIVDAWLLYARVAENRKQAIQCLERALRLDPENHTGLKMLAMLKPPQKPLHPVEPEKPDTSIMPDALPDTSRHSSLSTTLQPNEVQQRINPQTRSKVSQTKAKPKSDISIKAERENRIIWAVVILFAICLLAVVCMALFQNSFDFSQIIGAPPTPSKDELLSVINLNISAANAENIDSYLNTIHSKSPLYRQTESALKDAFSTYDLSYSVAALRVEKQSGSEAEVHFVLTTRKIKGPDFKDNVIEGTFIMRPEDGVWKIYDQKNLDVTYLN